MQLLTHLGIMDWGIGGLDLYSRITRRCPQLRVTYVSDSGFTPYGKLAPSTLAARVQTLVEWFEGQGATLVLVACNAASTVLPLPRHSGIPTLGVIQPTLNYLRERRPPAVVVLGGQRTIDSGVYQRALEQAGIATRGIVAQPLSALVEAGQLSGAELERTLTLICHGVGSVDTLVPACTHYIAVLPALLQFLNPSQVVDPASVTLTHLFQSWNVALTSPEQPGIRQLLTTGSAPEMERAAARAFGIELPHIRELHTDLVPRD